MTLLLAVAIAALAAQQPETLSLLDEPLYPPPVPKNERARLDAEIAEARAAAARDPANADAVLRLARAQRQLGHVGDALETLTRALEARTETPAIHLERGRGFLAIRKFDLAQREIKKAADAIPDARCDLALTYYLNQDYKRAAQEYAHCAQPGVFAFLSSRRAGEATGARPEPPADERQSRDVKLPGSVRTPASKPAASMAAAYMDAIDRLSASDTAGARKLLQPLVEKHKADWMEPVYIAAENDYARIVKSEPKKKKKKK